MSELTNSTVEMANAARLARIEARIKVNREVRALEEQFRDPWVEKHGLRKFRFTGRNIMRLVQSAPYAAKKRKAVEHLRERLGGYSFDFNALDHPEMWGRDGKPLVIVGHPYGIQREGNIEPINALVDVGLEVRINRKSWYGFGTYHIEIGHPSLYENA